MKDYTLFSDDQLRAESRHLADRINTINLAEEACKRKHQREIEQVRMYQNALNAERHSRAIDFLERSRA